MSAFSVDGTHFLEAEYYSSDDDTDDVIDSHELHYTFLGPEVTELEVDLDESKDTAERVVLLDHSYSAYSRYPTVSQITMETIDKYTETPVQATEFLQSQGLLPLGSLCPKCGNPMKTYYASGHWANFKCNRRTCNLAHSIRKGTFFEHCHLPLKVILKFCHMFLHGKASHKNLREEGCIKGGHHIVQWKTYLRDIFRDYFMDRPSVIGGVGHVVEVDQSSFRIKDSEYSET